MPKVTIKREPSYEDMLQITRNLRGRDMEELSATSYSPTPEGFAHAAVSSGGFRWGTYVDGRPVGAGGAVPRWPNVWTVWAYGTDEFEKTILSATRQFRRFIIPALYRAGAVRVDCFALASHTDACAWLQYLGAEPDNKLDSWGKNGETFINYVWTRKKMKQILTEQGQI